MANFKKAGNTTLLVLHYDTKIALGGGKNTSQFQTTKNFEAIKYTLHTKCKNLSPKSLALFNTFILTKKLQSVENFEQIDNEVTVAINTQKTRENQHHSHICLLYDNKVYNILDGISNEALVLNNQQSEELKSTFFINYNTNSTVSINEETIPASSFKAQKDRKTGIYAINKPEINYQVAYFTFVEPLDALAIIKELTQK